jgi:small conductance mechanosensitive channel
MEIFMFQNNNTNSSVNILENASKIKDVAWGSIDNILTSIIGQLPYIVAGIIVLLIFLLLSRAVKGVFWATSNKTGLDYRLRILINRLIGLSIVLLGFFAALTVIIPSFRFGDLIAGLGFTSFVVGFASKDILNNFLSGVLILWKQPFQIGDYIFIEKFQGKVEQIGVRATRLKADDGEQILIPNGDMYSNALIIRGAGANRRMSLRVNLGYDADINKAKQIIYKALRDLSGVIDDPAPKVYVKDLSAEGVNLAIYFWINTHKDQPIEVFDQTATVIKTALRNTKIELYPPNTAVVQSPKEENQAESGT